ncbi:WavQ [Escherichia coli]|nr:WavQ [Escherichia coli]
MNIYIYTNSYDENSGGSVVLHRLCHIINKYSTHNAYLVKLDPFYYGSRTIRKFLSKLKWELYSKFRFKTNNEWDTPVWLKLNDFPSDSVVIYPEIINGNPLKIKNVVRWLLHQPGYHTNIVDYGKNELYFKFNSAINDFYNEGSFLASHELKVIYYPIQIYNNKISQERDIECCYLIRKGSDKKIVHPPNSIKIDGLTHQQIANIFKRAQKFISYDDYTAYSIFSVLCGCPSYVVPTDEQSVNDWYPNESDRYGIAYGFTEEQINWAAKTKDRVYSHIVTEHNKSIDRVINCLQEIELFFDNNKL